MDVPFAVQYPKRAAAVRKYAAASNQFWFIEFAERVLAKAIDIAWPTPGLVIERAGVQ